MVAPASSLPSSSRKALQKAFFIVRRQTRAHGHGKTQPGFFYAGRAYFLFFLTGIQRKVGFLPSFCSRHIFANPQPLQGRAAGCSEFSAGKLLERSGDRSVAAIRWPSRIGVER